MPQYGEQEYQGWLKKKSKRNMGKLVKKFSGILHSELPKYYGNLPKGVLKSYGKKFIISAVKTYDPNKGKLSNHIVQNLQRLHRVNYETSGVFRMSEELQSGVNLFKGSKSFLEDKLGREPTNEELSKELHWSPTKVARMEKQIKKEVLSGALEMSPVFINAEDPRLDYLYHDLPPEDKLVFQYRVGYRGAPILPVKDIAKKIKMSPATVSNKAMGIANKIVGILKDR
jgi:hypothetical protein